jgi:hypothetical protein
VQAYPKCAVIPSAFGEGSAVECAMNNKKAKSRFLVKATRNDRLGLSVTKYANMVQQKQKEPCISAKALFETALFNNIKTKK